MSEQRTVTYTKMDHVKIDLVGLSTDAFDLRGLVLATVAIVEQQSSRFDASAKQALDYLLTRISDLSDDQNHQVHTMLSRLPMD